MQSYSSSINISTSATAINTYCTKFENLCRAFPGNVDLRVLPEDRLQWKVTAPFNVELEGIVEHRSLASGRVLLWNSSGEDAPNFEIMIEIFEEPAGDECEVHLTYSWEPLSGDLCAKALVLSGLHPQTLIPKVLLEMKRALETHRSTGLRAIVTDFFAVDVWSPRSQVV
ncbi:MAG: hypothetical protein KF767_00685 [Bdellovibrionaceae bacterium]|nr:hypothetical protein [Pseudobdellovibrionaceae bacterium]